MFEVNDTVRYSRKLQAVKPYVWSGPLTITKTDPENGLVTIQNKIGQTLDELPVFLPQKG